MEKREWRQGDELWCGRQNHPPTCWGRKFLINAAPMNELGAQSKFLFSSYREPRRAKEHYEIEERASKIDFSLPGCLSIFLGHGTNMQQRIYHTWGWCPLLPVLARRSPLPGIFQYRLAGWFVHDASGRVSHLGHDASAVPAWNATARIPVSTRKIICISSNILFSTRKWHCALDESRCQTGCDFLWLLIEENVQFFPVYFKTK